MRRGVPLSPLFLLDYSGAPMPKAANQLSFHAMGKWFGVTWGRPWASQGL